MKRFLVLVGLIGAAAYMFGPPRLAPQDQVELALSAPSVSGPLRTSWGFTLKSLRQAPASPQDISQDIASPTSLATAPDRLLTVGESDGELLEWARATLAAYRRRSEPSKPSEPDAASPEAPPEMWVIGQTNGWVHDDDGDPRGLPSYEYVAAIDHLRFGQSAAEESSPAKPASTKTQQAALVAAVAKPESPDPAVKPVAYTTDDIKVAGPYRPRGLFARHVRSDDGPRARGLFGLFGGRKTEHPEVPAGPAG